MSFRVELTIEEKKYNVRRFLAFLSREEDAKGRPVADTNWRLDVLIDSVKDTGITGWMLDPKKQIDGTLTIYKIAEESILKEIEFKKCVCYQMWDHFNSHYSIASTSMSISGKDLKIKSAFLIQSYPGVK